MSAGSRAGLDEEFRARKRTLLILDEAQNLPDEALEELRLLSNNQIGGQALIQIVLLGQPEFRDQLASPGLEQLRQRVIATHHLDAMGVDEVKAYIRTVSLFAATAPRFREGVFRSIDRRSAASRRVTKLANVSSSTPRSRIWTSRAARSTRSQPR